MSDTTAFGKLPARLLPSEPFASGKVRQEMGGNYQAERRVFGHRCRTVQWQFVAVDNDRVARSATRARLTVCGERRPLQRALNACLEGGNYRPDRRGRLSSGYYHYQHGLQFMPMRRYNGIFIPRFCLSVVEVWKVTQLTITLSSSTQAVRGGLRTRHWNTVQAESLSYLNI